MKDADDNDGDNGCDVGLGRRQRARSTKRDWAHSLGAVTVQCLGTTKISQNVFFFFFLEKNPFLRNKI